MTSEASAGAESRCAVHPDRIALRSCERCGNFACTDCLGEPGAPTERFCTPCRDRGAAGHVAWEGGGSFFERYAATCRAAILEPRATFAAVGAGDLGKPAGFAAISSFVGYGPLLLCVPFVFLLLLTRAPTLDRTMLVAVPCALVFYPGVSFLYFSLVGLMFHGLAVLLGGRAPASTSLRAGWYSAAWEPISAGTMILYCIPLVGALLMIGASVAGAAWRAIALRTVGERDHGLSPGRALAAAAITAGFWLVTFLALLGAVIGFAIYQRFDRL